MQTSKPIQRVALIYAMEAEALPLVHALKLSPPVPACTGTTLLWHAGRHATLEILVSANGSDGRFGCDRIGTEAATINAFVVCSQWKPDLLISAGTAGGFASRGGVIGDVYLSDGVVRFHDHRIPLPGFERYGEGLYPALRAERLASALGAKMGVVSTGNSLDTATEDLAILNRFGAHAKEMEAAAVAQVAFDFGIPMLAVKAITDLVDSPEETAEEFLRNLHTASARLCDKLLLAVEFVAQGRSPAEL